MNRIAKATVTHIGWPLRLTHRPKPAKECACANSQKKFSKMANAGLWEQIIMNQSEIILRYSIDNV